MQVDVLLGLQWGDEGKGKIVDYLAPHYNVVARFQGGPNAGHTLEFDNIKHVLHQIPSGIFRPNLHNVIGNGVVLDPIVFKIEIDKLEVYNTNALQRLSISKKAQLILPTHKLLDAAYERAKGEQKIGSTLKGIGPAYTDKISRVGLRVGDIVSPTFKERYQKQVEGHKRLLAYYNFEYDLTEQEAAFFEAIDYMKQFSLVDSELYINDALNQEQSVLAEGAQGSLLDVDFGTYPFVTSSTTMVAGACTGLGIAPQRIGRVFGIFKAYCTRVGGGPFPTELHDDTGQAMRKEGNEFGATTGRPRRCGWLDLPALRYAIMLNGATHLFMMKADVLSIFDEIKVCTHYKLPDGTITDQMPFEVEQGNLEPIYETLPGWGTSLDGITEYDALPAAVHHYVDYLQGALNTPISIVSIGPDRTQTIIREDFLKTV